MKTLKLDNILSTFTKTLNDLDKLILQNNKTVAKNTSKIMFLSDANAELETESTKATSVKEKISKLLD